MSRRILLALLLLAALAWPQNPERIVAVGDVHGDFANFVAVLRDAGVLDKRNRWAGGKTVMVQTGDVVDRGPGSRKILDLLMNLEKTAARAGGRVHALIGNHEAMNVYGDLRYVSPQEFASHKHTESAAIRDNYFNQFVLPQRGPDAPPEEQLRKEWEAEHPLGWVEHRFAFGPQGQYGKWLLNQNAAVKVGDTLFLHGGIGPKYASLTLDEINQRVRAELKDFSLLEGGMVMDEEGPLWYRGLAVAPEAELAAHLDAVLEFHGVRRIAVGHTVLAPAILTRFAGKVVLLDCGLSKGYNNLPAALVIERGKAFAMHRGKLLELPSTPETFAAYIRAAAALDPPPSPLLQLLQGPLPTPPPEK